MLRVPCQRTAIGFVFSQSETAEIVIFLLYINVYIHFSSFEIGFVLQNYLAGEPPDLLIMIYYLLLAQTNRNSPFNILHKTYDPSIPLRTSIRYAIFVIYYTNITNKCRGKFQKISVTTL